LSYSESPGRIYSSGHFRKHATQNQEQKQQKEKNKGEVIQVDFKVLYNRFFVTIRKLW